ncbi:MAG: hypothetical protein ACREJ4_05450, partial [Candidatus Methylomirabilaceae bacterium]
MSLTFGSTAKESAILFHALSGGGAGPNSFEVSRLEFATAGQPLGPEGYFGVNGFRIDDLGFLDIDRSQGQRRGW